MTTEQIRAHFEAEAREKFPYDKIQRWNTTPVAKQEGWVAAKMEMVEEIEKAWDTAERRKLFEIDGRSWLISQLTPPPDKATYINNLFKAKP